LVRLEDQRILDFFEDALSEWDCPGFVAWKKRPSAWLEEEISDTTTKEVGKLIHRNCFGRNFDWSNCHSGKHEG